MVFIHFDELRFASPTRGDDLLTLGYYMQPLQGKDGLVLSTQGGAPLTLGYTLCSPFRALEFGHLEPFQDKRDSKAPRGRMHSRHILSFLDLRVRVCRKTHLRFEAEKKLAHPEKIFYRRGV